MQQSTKIKNYSWCYAKMCNEWWPGLSPQLSAWVTQLRWNVATMTGSEIEADTLGTHIHVLNNLANQPVRFVVLKY